MGFTYLDKFTFLNTFMMELEQGGIIPKIRHRHQDPCSDRTVLTTLQRQAIKITIHLIPLLLVGSAI